MPITISILIIKRFRSPRCMDRRGTVVCLL